MVSENDLLAVVYVVCSNTVITLCVPHPIYISLQYQVLYIDPLCAACKPTCTREDQTEEDTALAEGSDDTTERLVSDFVNSVYDMPDWKSLGQFSGEQHVTFQTAARVAMYAGKWKRKALSVSDRRPSQQPVDSQEHEARKISSIPAFLPGRILQIDTEKKPLR